MPRASSGDMLRGIFVGTQHGKSEGEGYDRVYSRAGRHRQDGCLSFRHGGAHEEGAYGKRTRADPARTCDVSCGASPCRHDGERGRGIRAQHRIRLQALCPACAAGDGRRGGQAHHEVGAAASPEAHPCRRGRAYAGVRACGKAARFYGNAGRCHGRDAQLRHRSGCLAEGEDRTRRRILVPEARRSRAHLQPLS